MGFVLNQQYRAEEKTGTILYVDQNLQPQDQKEAGDHEVAKQLSKKSHYQTIRPEYQISDRPSNVEVILVTTPQPRDSTNNQIHGP